MTLNGGRPLPWADCPKCPACQQYCMAPVEAFVKNGERYGRGPNASNARIVCSNCRVAIRGGPKSVAQARRAQKAWELYESGRIHHDKGCERCNGALFLDRFRLCANCVDADNAERQVPMFAEAM